MMAMNDAWKFVSGFRVPGTTARLEVRRGAVLRRRSPARSCRPAVEHVLVVAVVGDARLALEVKRLVAAARIPGSSPRWMQSTRDPA
jgi:hypothetical protein